jgi:hypothetical protein
MPLRNLFLRTVEAILASAAAVSRFARSAMPVPEGYEDEQGFHFGRPIPRDLPGAHVALDRTFPRRLGLGCEYRHRVVVIRSFPRNIYPGSN